MLRGLIVLAALTPIAGCNQGECVGTLRFGNKCVAVDPFDKTPPTLTVDPPLFTREVGTVRIVSDEPATIFFSIDGTTPTEDSTNAPDEAVLTGVPDNATLRYFAIDLNGNRSSEELRLWVIDKDGPSPPLDFDLTLASSARTVNWTAAPDPRPGGVLVARVEGRLAATPEAGKEYAVGDELAAGVTIVALDTSTTPATFSETLAVRPGLVRYVAWGYDSLFNYGPPAGDYELVDIPAQTAQVTAVGNTATVTMPPTNLTLTATATHAGTTQTLKLGMRNDTTRILFAPKVVLTSTLPNGVAWTDATGLINTTQQYRAYGSAILPGASIEQTYTLTGVAATDTLTLDLQLRNDRVLTATIQDFSTNSGGQVVDEITGTKLRDYAAGAVGDDGASMSYCVAYTPDGKLLTGGRTSGTVTSFDVVTGQRTVSSTLRPQKSHIPVLTLDRSGSVVYALVSNGHPNKLNQNQGAGADSELVRLDAGTLTVNGRIQLGPTRTKNMEISPDGKTLIIASNVSDSGAIVVDLTKFEIETKLVTNFRAQAIAFSPDGGTFAVIGDQIQLYTRGEPGTGFVEGLSFPTPEPTEGKVVRAVWPNPAEIWIGRGFGSVSKVDISTNTPTTFLTIPGTVLDHYDGKLYVTANSSTTVNVIDFTGAIVSTVTGFNRLQGHHIARSPF